jgi:hypothetical protein
VSRFKSIAYICLDLPRFISNSVNKNNGDQIYIVSLGIESHLLHTLESGHLTIAIEVARYDLYTSFCLNLPRLDFDWGSMTSQELSLTFDLTVTFPTHNKHRCLTMSSNFAWQATRHQKIKWPPHIAPYVQSQVNIWSSHDQRVTSHDRT